MRKIFFKDVIWLWMVLNLLENKSMKVYDKFKNNWETKLLQMFWYRFEKKAQNLDVFYFFEFGTIKSDARLGKNGSLYLCFIYDKRETDDFELQKKWKSQEKILMNIFKRRFKDKNEKYLGFSKFSKDEDFRDVLWALFLLGNENDIEDNNLIEFLMSEKVKAIYENFRSQNLNADEAFDYYISEIVNEFERVALKLNEEIFRVKCFRDFSSQMVKNMPFLKEKD